MSMMEEQWQGEVENLAACLPEEINKANGKYIIWKCINDFDMPRGDCLTQFSFVDLVLTMV
jgi:hypothetical protein